MFHVKLAAIALVLVAPLGIASNQNHECQGGHNCNGDTGNPVVVDVTHDVDQNVSLSADSVHETVQTVSTGDQIVSLSVELPDPGLSSTSQNEPVQVTNNLEPADITIGGNTSTYRESARTAIAGYGNTTASCFRTYGIGGSTRDASWSLGWPLKDGDCALGEDAAQAFLMGNELAAWRMYCHQSTVRKVYGAKRWNAKSKAEAVDACLIEAGLAQMILANSDLAEEMRAALAKANTELAALRLQVVDLVAIAHKPGSSARPITEADVVRLLAEAAPPALELVTIDETEYETVAGVQAGAQHITLKSAPAAVECPPKDSTVAAVMCDGLPVLNPNRRPLPAETP